MVIKSLQTLVDETLKEIKTKSNSLLPYPTSTIFREGLHLQKIKSANSVIQKVYIPLIRSKHMMNRFS